jgi:glutathione S-transferase
MTIGKDAPEPEAGGQVRLHQSWFSGNCYKVRLVLTQVGIPFETVEVDLAAGEARGPAFRALAPLGRVPVVVLDGGAVLAESNAILCYFAEGTPLLPTDRLERAQVMQWLFWEQYSHEPYVAVARAWVRYFGVPAGKEKELEERRERGRHALQAMDSHLAERSFLVAERYTIADIALYAYTHVADDGGFDLSAYPAVRRWLDKVSAQPGHVTLESGRPGSP